MSTFYEKVVKGEEKKVRFAIFGAKGWRAKFYLRAVKALPEVFEVCAIYEESEERAKVIREQLSSFNAVNLKDIPIVSSLEELKKYEPEFIVMSVGPEVLKQKVPEAAEAGFYVLQETFWPESVKDLSDYYASVSAPERVQVAEQYCFQSHHAARLNVIASGLLGDVEQAQVSAAHGYHGVSLIRHYLGIGYEPAEIVGRSMETLTSAGPGRDGYPKKEEFRKDIQKVALLKFFMENGSSKWAVFDFTDESYFNQIRKPHTLIRGSRGEMDERDVRTLTDFCTPVEMPVKRVSGGCFGELTPPCIDKITVGEGCYYKNPYPGARLTDEETAIATMLGKMAEYVRGQEPVYSLEEGCQDMYLALLIEQACETGIPVQTEKMPWQQ